MEITTTFVTSNYYTDGKEQYAIEYYYDVDDNFYHIDLIDQDAGLYILNLYAKGEEALKSNIEALKNHYNVIRIEDQGKL